MSKAWASGSHSLVGQALDGILVLLNINKRYTRHLPQASPQFAVACRDKVALVRLDTVHNAIIGICALVRAGQALETWVTSYPKSNAVLGSQLLELSEDTICDAWNGRGIQCVHQTLNDFDLVL